MSQISVSDIVNAKIVDLLLECCRKTVMECAYHYNFDAQEALGKMGLLTDYSALTNLTMSSVNMTMSMSGMNSETGSVSDVSVEGVVVDVVVKDDSSVKTKVLAENEGKKGKKEKVVKEKVVKEKVVKEKVVKEKKAKGKAVAVAGVDVPLVVPLGVDVVVPVPVPVGLEEEVMVIKDDNSSISSESKKKGRPKKEAKEKVVKEKGRPKKEKKETESSSAIDDLFANLVAKDVVKEEVNEVVKETVVVKEKVVVNKVNEVVVSKAESEKQVPKVDVVNKMEFQGTTYLKSKNTGMIYNMEQDVVGKWNENTMTIDFDEEEEEEYEDE